jgi:serine-type D-Ala-D-Ala carboxypeptidase/endopeptidase
VLIAAAAPAAATHLALDDGAVRALFVHRVDAEQRAPGMVVGIIDGRGARILTHGMASPASATPVKADTLFEIGSITKPLTATVLARLAARGVLRLDDPVARWLPELAPAPDGIGSITLRQLASHTSGLPRLPTTLGFFLQMLRDPADPYARYTRDDLLADLTKMAPTTPGAFAYSNLGYALLGLVLERATGRSYAQLLADEVLQPAGVAEATLELTHPRLAAGHRSDGEPTAHWQLGPFAAAGALRMSARDMLRLLAAALATQPPFDVDVFAAKAARDTGEAPARTVALGWMRREADDGPLIWHNGGTGGFRSFVGFRPQQGLGVFVFANSEAEVDDLALHLLDPAQPLQAPSAAARPLRGITWLLALLTLVGVARLALPANSPVLRWWKKPATAPHAALDWIAAAATLAFLWRIGDWTLAGFDLRFATGVAFAIATLAALRASLRPGAFPSIRPQRSIAWSAMSAVVGLLLAGYVWL